MIVEIQEDGKTILLKTLEEYNRMRESSPYTISEFNKETIVNIQNRIKNEANNDSQPIKEQNSPNFNHGNNNPVSHFHSQSSQAFSSSNENLLYHESDEELKNNSLSCKRLVAATDFESTPTPNLKKTE